MRTIALAWLAAAALGPAAAVLADASASFQAGREALRSYHRPPHRPEDLHRAEDAFREALRQDPQHHPSAVFLALTGLAGLTYDEEVNRLLTRLGLSEKGRDPLDWKAEWTHPLPVTGLGTRDVMDLLGDRTLARLDDALQAVASIPDTWTDSIRVATNETPYEKEVELDLGDVCALRAAVYGAHCLAELRRAYHFDVPVDGLAKSDAANNLSASIPGLVGRLLLDHPGLFTLTNRTAQAAAKDYAARTVAAYRKATEVIRAEQDPQGDDLISGLLLSTADHYIFSLEKPTLIDFKHGFRERFFFGRLFDEPGLDRTLNPRFNDWNEPVPGTFPDPTFKGLFPDLTQERLTAYLKWMHRWPKGKRHLFGVRHAGGRFVAVGEEGTVLVSDHARDWSLCPSGTDQALKDAAYGNGRYVAVGRGGAVAISSDGSAWTAASVGESLHFEAICFAEGLFVAVCSGGEILYSPDGTLWETTFQAGQPLWDLVRGGGLFVAVGSNRALYFSPDARTWRAAASGGKESFHAVCYGKGTFVAAGGAYDAKGDYRALVWTSPDGRSWIPRNPAGRKAMWGAVYAHDTFVLCGEGGEVIRSADGATWTLDYTPLSTRLEAVACGDGQFVAVGEKGRVLVSYAEEEMRRGPLPRELVSVSTRQAVDGADDLWRYLDNRYRGESEGIVLEVRKAVVRGGETMAVTCLNLPKEGRHPSAWIGLYRSPRDADRDYVQYTFLRNLMKDTYDLPAPEEGGRFHFRLFRDGGYDRIAISPEIEVERRK